MILSSTARQLALVPLFALACGGASQSEAPRGDANDGGVPELGPDGVLQGACPTPLTGVIVAPGGQIAPRPAGTALRIELAYQKDVVAITGVRGADKTLPGSVAPLQAGLISGYWYELQDADGAALYTRTFQDPNNVEIFGSGDDGDGGFTNQWRSLCEPKDIRADVPNDPAGRVIVFFGSAAGTHEGAKELARFFL